LLSGAASLTCWRPRRPADGPQPPTRPTYEVKCRACGTQVRQDIWSRTAGFCSGTPRISTWPHPGACLGALPVWPAGVPLGALDMPWHMSLFFFEHMPLCLEQ
jgi:hypothetical protein